MSSMKVCRLQPAKQGASMIPVPSLAPTPAPKAAEVRISIKAASLNYRDLIVASPQNVGRIPLSDASGIVDAVGPDVKRWTIGDHVAIPFFPEWFDGRFDASHLKTARGADTAEGVLAEYVIAEERSLISVPNYLSFAETSCLPCAGVTAWHALKRSCIGPGQSLLVMGTGGVALFGLQFGLALGARVIVLSSSDEKLHRARQLGASITINYRQKQDWDRVVVDMTDGRGADCILELGGKNTYERSLRALSAGGKIAQIGVLAGFDPTPGLMRLQSLNADIVGVTVGSIAHFQAMNDFMTRHRIHPVVGSVCEFDEAAEAYEMMRAGAHFGKIVLRHHG